MGQCSSASPAGVLSVAERQLKTALCSSGLLPQQAVRVSLPAPVRDSAPGLGTPQPVTPAACVALAALRKTVVGADKGPSDLMGHCLGLHTVDQLLEVPKWPLPAAQLDRATMPRPQPLSDNVLYLPPRLSGRPNAARWRTSGPMQSTRWLLCAALSWRGITGFIRAPRPCRRERKAWKEDASGSVNPRLGCHTAAVPRQPTATWCGSSAGRCRLPGNTIPSRRCKSTRACARSPAETARTWGSP